MQKYITIRGTIKIVCSSAEELNIDDEIVIENMGTPIRAVVSVMEKCIDKVPAYWEAVAKVDLKELKITPIESNKTNRKRTMIMIRENFFPFVKHQVLGVEVDEDGYHFTTYDKSDVVIPLHIGEEV